MAYASPVDRTTGIIGDFGVTLYVGQKPAIKEHLVQCLELDRDITRKIAVGMKLSDVAHIAAILMAERGLANTVASINDPAGTNIGHSIPALAEGWSKQETAVFEQGDWQTTKDMIAHKRHYVSTIEATEIQDGIAFTIEPRPEVPNHPDIPMVAYHTIVAFDRGEKLFLTDFDEVFRLAGMDYMPSVTI